MDEDKRKEMVALAKKGELFDADGNKINIFHPSLRAPKPEIIKPEPPPEKSDTAQALELVAQAFTQTQQLAAESSAAQTSAIVTALHQSAPVKAVVVPRVMEQFKVEFKRDNQGRMISPLIFTQIR